MVMGAVAEGDETMVRGRERRADDRTGSRGGAAARKSLFPALESRAITRARLEVDAVASSPSSWAPISDFTTMTTVTYTEPALQTAAETQATCSLSLSVHKSRD